MIDADWAMCAGCWMWVSSSAFETSLNASYSLDTSVGGATLDPHGNYIRLQQHIHRECMSKWVVNILLFAKFDFLKTIPFFRNGMLQV